MLRAAHEQIKSKGTTLNTNLLQFTKGYELYDIKKQEIKDNKFILGDNWWFVIPKNSNEILLYNKTEDTYESVPSSELSDEDSYILRLNEPIRELYLSNVVTLFVNILNEEHINIPLFEQFIKSKFTYNSFNIIFNKFNISRFNEEYDMYNVSEEQKYQISDFLFLVIKDNKLMVVYREEKVEFIIDSNYNSLFTYLKDLDSNLVLELYYMLIMNMVFSKTKFFLRLDTNYLYSFIKNNI